MPAALVVDDELDICLMVTNHLRRLNFETQYALTVKDAFAKVDTFPFELMLLDLNLSDGSGLEVLEYVTTLESRPKIIVISAYDSEKEKVLEKGADFFIPKPFTLKKVSEALGTLDLA